MNMPIARTRRRRPAKTRTIHFRVTEEVYLRLSLKADRERRDLSEIGRTALENCLVADA